MLEKEFVVMDSNANDYESDDIEYIFDELSQVEGDFIAIADIGKWNGRFKGYSEKLKNNLKNIPLLLCGDYLKIVVKNDDLVLEDSHHDGTNYITIRKWRKSVSEKKKDEILNEWVFKNALLGEFDGYTSKLGRKVKAIFG